MAILTEYSLQRYVDRLLVIHPLRSESITGVGYDLTVGLYAKVDPRTRTIDLVDECDDSMRAEIFLEPNTYLIVISREYVYLSRRLAATFHSKSSLAAQAVYLNSTTGDPNWSGRLIFSLYNASGIRVQLDLNATFTTMVLHKTERPSRLEPRESKAVIERYLRGLNGDHARIVGYVLRDDDIRREFRSKARRAKSLTALPFPVFQAVFYCLRLVDAVRQNRSVIILAAFGVVFLVLWLYPGALVPVVAPNVLETGASIATILTFAGTVVAAAVKLWRSWRRGVRVHEPD